MLAFGPVRLTVVTVVSLVVAGCAARCPPASEPGVGGLARSPMPAAEAPAGNPPLARTAPRTAAFTAVEEAAMAAADAEDSSSRMRVHLVDVGQGAATLFEFPCGAVLVDTGGETNDRFDGQAKLDAYLDKFFDGRPDLDRTLDAVFITHPHIDHTRGASTRQATTDPGTAPPST